MVLSNNFSPFADPYIIMRSYCEFDIGRLDNESALLKAMLFGLSCFRRR